MHQLREVVSLIKIFKHRGQNLGLLFGEVDPFGVGLDELTVAGGFEEWGLAEDFLMTSKESLFGTNADRDDGRRQGTEEGYSQLE